MNTNAIGVMMFPQKVREKLGIEAALVTGKRDFESVKKSLSGILPS